MSVLKLTAPLLISLATVNCGGSGDSNFQGVGTTTGPVEIIISENGQSIERAPKSDDKVTITGSNNLIWLRSKAQSVRVTGNDNMITTPPGSTVYDRGIGNDITYSNSADNGNSNPTIPK